MAIVEIKTRSREEWLALRKDYIGGSDAGALMGLNPYCSPYALWAEKTGKVPGFAGNITTKVGSYLEELVARMFTEETGKRVQRKNCTMVNTDYPFACADIDRRVVGEKALLECKTTNSFPVMRKVRGGEYPEQWYCQMMHYMMVTGMEKAYLAVLINCRDFQIFELERDEAEIAALAKAEKAFWEENVKKNTPPPADGSESTTEAMEAIYRETAPNGVDLFGRGGMLDEYFSLADAKRSLERQMETIKQTIMEDMGSAEVGTCGGYKVTWKPTSRTTFDSKAFAADHTELNLEKYTKTSTSRRFTVKKEN